MNPAQYLKSGHSVYPPRPSFPIQLHTLILSFEVIHDELINIYVIEV
jgi:hypothetical protein